MPNRVLRDWTCSELVNDLSEGAEVFFVRLIMKADDFGCFYGNVKLVKAALFPLKDISEKKIEKYIEELIKSEIVTFYEVDKKKYLQIIDFGQRLRTMKGKFPLPDSNSRSIVSNSPPETETETETEVETKQKSNVLFVELSSESRLDQFENIAFEFWKLFKQNSKELGVENSTTLDKAKIKSWSNQIRLMIEVDNRTTEQIKTVYKALQTGFWKKVIRSTDKLRTNFEKIIIDTNHTTHGTQTNRKPTHDELIAQQEKEFRDEIEAAFDGDGRIIGT